MPLMSVAPNVIHAMDNAHLRSLPPMQDIDTVAPDGVAPGTIAKSVFKFGTFDIRVMTVAGNPWFCGSDILTVLYGTSNGMGCAYRVVNDDERTTVDRIHFGFARGGPRVVALSESGFYKLVMRSDKPEAKAFQEWVTREVLPTIRKTGSYSPAAINVSPAADAGYRHGCT